MQLSKQESLEIMRLWSQADKILTIVLNRALEEYTKNITRQDTQWETLRQSIEYTSKRQALVDLKNILSKNYDS